MSTKQTVKVIICALLWVVGISTFVTDTSATSHISCTGNANRKFCDDQDNKLKTCNSTGTGIDSSKTIDCTEGGGVCAVDPFPRCKGGSHDMPQTPIPSSGGGNPDDVLIDLGQVIDNVLVPLKFRFSSTSTLGDIIGALIPYLYAIAGIALLLFLIGGGYGYLTSAGDPKKIEAAKNTITLAIIGFLIIIAAYWATQIANYIFSLGSPIR